MAHSSSTVSFASVRRKAPAWKAPPSGRHGQEGHAKPSAAASQPNLLFYAIGRTSAILFETAWFAIRSVVAWTLALLTGKDEAYRQAKFASQLTGYFQTLGGTFIKLAQFLAARSDFMPPVYCDELSRLLDDAAPFSNEEAIALLTEELGEGIFDSFSKPLGQPIAAASFGQVYRVTLHSGVEIALKIQRPEARGNTRVDLFLLGRMATLLDASMLLKNLEAKSVADAFRKWTMEELDYQQEARSAEMMRTNLLNSPGARRCEYYPEVYWEFTTGRTLALEFIEGIWLTDLLRPGSLANRRLQRMPDARRLQIAHNIFYAFLHQVFEDGFFHGDPHPGNIAILAGDVIGMVDFGVVGKMSNSLKDHMARVLRFASTNDTRRTFFAAAEIFDVPSDVNMKKLQASYEENLEEWYQANKDPRATKREKSFAGLLLKNIDTVRRFGITLPTNVFRYYRSFITLDPLLQDISPDFTITTEMKAFFTNLYQKDMLSDCNITKYLDALLQYQRLGLRLPENFNTIVRTFEQAPEQIVDYERRVRLFSAAIFANASRLSWVLIAYAVAANWFLKNRLPIWPGLALVSGGRLPLFIAIALAFGWISRHLRYRSGKV